MRDRHGVDHYCSAHHHPGGKKIQVRHEPGMVSLTMVLVLLFLFPIVIAGYGKVMAFSETDGSNGPLLKIVDHSYRKLSPLPAGKDLAVCSSRKENRSS